MTDRLGVAFSRGLPPADVVEAIAEAEQLGYHSAWVPEGHGGDQFAVLAAAAARTRRILLGTSISSVFVRSAPTIAMAAATVDHISSGRFILGLGSSHRVQVEPEHGVPFANPVQRVRETVQVVRALLRDGVVSHRGQVLNIERFDLWFTPARRELPIYVSALFGPMLEVAGEVADGAIMIWSTLAAPGQAREHLAAGARRAGRDAGAIDVASMLPCVVSDDRGAALDALRPSVATYAGYFPRYNRLLAESGFPDEVAAIKRAWDRGDQAAAAALVPDALVDAVAIAGPAAYCRERLAAYRRAGLALPIVSPRGAVIAAVRALAP